MKAKNGIFIKLALALTLIVANVMASTPGSACALVIDPDDTGPLPPSGITGQVSSDGQRRAPTLPIPIPGLEAGVGCGTAIRVGPALILSECPN
jgi:hypothetical protein